MTGEQVIEHVTEYETPWYTGGYDMVEHPDGTTKQYYWAELPPAVAVVALTDDEHIVMVEQYRPAVGERCVECPMGMVEAGESYTEAAARELREETGYVAEDLTLIDEFHVATGILRHKRGVVLAEDLTPGDTDPDENEHLTLREVPAEDAIDTSIDTDTTAGLGSVSALLLADWTTNR